MPAPGLDLLLLLMGVPAAYLAGLWLRGRQLRALLAELAQLRTRLEEERVAAAQLRRRCGEAEELVSGLQRSIVEIPEIAQRLSAARDLREIPERTLELLQEVFDPTYAAFYRNGRKGLVAVAVSGECEYAVGHRLQRGEGVVGWTAMRQMPFTAEDAELESRMVRERHLALAFPQGGFSQCLPILSHDRTIGVILVGPCRRSLPQEREIGRTIALMASVSIASAVVLREESLLAKTDGLTGLANRTHVLEQLRDLLVSDATGPREVSIFLFDIDHFKQYNDSHGHLAGDELLKALAQLLRENVREGERLGRYGGEEFLLVLPDAGKDCALHAAERLRGAIAGHAFPFGATQPLEAVTISGGVATWPRDGENPETLLGRADEALYEAKRLGRNRVQAFRPPDLASQDEADVLFGLGPEIELSELEKPES